MILKKFRNNVVSNIFWWIILFCFFNISADVRMSDSKTVPTETIFNEQESIVELFFEKILGINDAIPEGENSETEDHHDKNNSIIDLFVPLYISTNSELSTKLFIRKNIYFFTKCKFLDSCSSIHTPPPEALFFI